jgi:hypothetical protein
MWNNNACTSPGVALGVLAALAMLAFGSGAMATEEAPVVLYESDHLGYGSRGWGFDSSFGQDVAIDGDALMVAEGGFEEQNYVTTFQQVENGSWEERDRFHGGESAHIEGQRALIGDQRRCYDDEQHWMDCYEGYGWGGVDYLEQLSDGHWVLVGESMRATASDVWGLGSNVDLSGSTAVATAYFDEWNYYTAVLIFEQIGDAWAEVYEIRLETRDVSIALDGDTLLVGDPGHESGGVVLMYRLNARGHWRPRGTFAPADLAPDAAFGWSVVIDGNRALVGAPGAGVAYVFERGTATGVWRERARLEAEPAPLAWAFGASVALDRETAVVGRPERENSEAGAGLGTAHVFVRESRSKWPRRAVLASTDGTLRSAFGSSLAIDGTDVVVGAPYQPEPGASPTEIAGAAYYFDLSVLSGDVRFVDIDVKPGSDDNVLDPGDTGTVWVAVLSAMDFDALQVDPATVAFGPGAALPDRDRVEDTNGDRIPDLKLRFAIPDIGLSCDATTLQLTGTTYAGEAIAGQETVEVVGCDEIVVKVKPLNADRGVVDLTEPSFYVFVMSEPGFDPASVNTESLQIDEFGGAPRGISYRDLNGDGVPELRLRYKTEDVQVGCGDHDIEVEVYIMAEGDPYADYRNGTLRVTVSGC